MKRESVAFIDEWEASKPDSWKARAGLFVFLAAVAFAIFLATQALSTLTYHS